MEGTEHGFFGCTQWAAVVNGIHQHGDAQGIAEQNEFLPLIRAELASGGQKVDGHVPLGFGQLDFPDKTVQVFDQRAHDGS